jgi:type I restriction enzyme S subunit
VELKPGYKETEVGVIPEEWDVALLDSVAKRGSGHTPDKKHPEYWDGEIKWISLKDSDRLDVLYIDDTEAKITPAGIANSSAVMHPAGTVVLSRDAGVGKSTIMRDAMAVSQHFIAWQCGPRLDNHFLYYWLQSEKPEFDRVANGSTIKTIGLPYFKRLLSPLPPVNEQRDIAGALSDVDALIGALDKLIAKKRDIKQAAMQQLLTGKQRLPGFHGEWEVKRLGSLGQFRGGGGFPRMHQGDTEGDYPFFKVSDMNNEGNSTFMISSNNWISESVRKQIGANTFPANTIVFAKIGAAVFLERKKILVQESCMDNNMMGFVLDDGAAYPRFIHYLFLTIQLGKLVATTALPSINGREIARLEYSIPSIPEQKAIAIVLSDMDAELAALEQRRDKTCALKQGMMQELLTGRTRLV